MIPFGLQVEGASMRGSDEQNGTLFSYEELNTAKPAAMNSLGARLTTIRSASAARSRCHSVCYLTQSSIWTGRRPGQVILPM